MPRTPRQSRFSVRDGGFTLLETIVALAIFAAVVAAAYDGMAGNWRGVGSARMQERAAGLGLSKLAAVGVEVPLAEGEMFADEEDGIRWSIVVERYAGPSAGEASAPVAAYWVKFEANWAGGAGRARRTLQMRTLKLARPS